MEENNTKQNSKENLKTVRTYLTDMADTVRANEISVIKVALAEQNKHEREDLYRKIEGTPTKKIFWFIGGVILIAGAIYGSTFLFEKKIEKEKPQIIEKVETIISYDEISDLDLVNDEDLIDKLITNKKEKSKINKIDSVKFIQIKKDSGGAKESILVSEIFSKLKFTSPSSMVRALTDSYMFGTYTKNASGSTGIGDSLPKLFMIFQNKDYGYSYAGMLEWEKTIASDMYDIFELNTNDDKTKVNERKWRDIIINNKDARVLFNENNKPILYYVFATKDDLIITDSSEAIVEIIARLAIKNMKPL